MPDRKRDENLPKKKRSFLRRSNRPKRQRPQNVSSFREAYLRFLDFFEGVFPPPREFASGDGDGMVESSMVRIPALIFYVPFFYILFILALFITYPFFFIATLLNP